MRRYFLLPFLMLLVGLPLPTRCQESATTAAAIADLEDRCKRLSSLVDEALAAQVSNQKRIDALANEVQRLRDDSVRSSHNSANYASVEDLKRLEETVRELDRKREADKKLILSEFEKLVTEFRKAARPPSTTLREKANPPDNPPAKDEKWYEYTIKPGDRLAKIVAELNKEGFKVTTDQILKANPKLKPEKLIAGKKIRIPAPAKD